MAAWQVRPPRLVTTAAARFITGSQSGAVESATSTSPSRKDGSSEGSETTRTGPAATLDPTARPVTSTRPRASRRYSSSTARLRREATVSGRACTT